jgi:hypothetical protein
MHAARLEKIPPVKKAKVTAGSPPDEIQDIHAGTFLADQRTEKITTAQGDERG